MVFHRRVAFCSLKELKKIFSALTFWEEKAGTPKGRDLWSSKAGRRAEPDFLGSFLNLAHPVLNLPVFRLFWLLLVQRNENVTWCWTLLFSALSASSHICEICGLWTRRRALCRQRKGHCWGRAVTLERTLNISVGCGEQLETADKTGRASHPEVLKAWDGTQSRKAGGFCRKGEAWGLRAPVTGVQGTERAEGPILGHLLWALAQHQPLWISISIFKVRIALNHWMFTDAEAPIFWPSDAKSQLIGKDPYAGKDWRQEEKGATKGEMVGWHHWLNGYEFEQTLGDNEGQRSLACCSPWGAKSWKDLATEWQQQQTPS